MTNIIEFPAPAPVQPDAPHISIVVENGQPVKWFEFACSFIAEDGSEYSFSIWARSQEHAQTRMRSLKSTANVDGQIFTQVPV